jgi:hypothetical protein
MDIDSFTLFTSSSNNLKLSESSLSSINNINEELLKIHSKITQQSFQQIGGNITSDSYKTSINKYNSVTEYSSDSSSSSTISKSNSNITNELSSTISKSKPNNEITFSSTNNFESIYGSDSGSLSDSISDTILSTNTSTNSSVQHKTNYLPKNSSFSSTSSIKPIKRVNKKK